MAKAKRFKTLTPCWPQLPEAYEAKGCSLSNEKLPALAEEMLWSLAHYYKNELYWDKIVKAGNFWKCLKPELTRNQQKLSFPADFEALLQKMQNKQAEIKEEKAAYRKEHKLEIATEKESKKEKFGKCIVDDSIQYVNYMVEAPSVIITRGEDPCIGSWKYRVREEDITLNCVNGKIPDNWKGKVVSDPTSQWVYKYQIELGRKEMRTHTVLPKKVNLGGSITQKNVEHKFDKTIDVLNNFSKIEQHILTGIKSDDEKTKQAALCAWLIMETGIRIGNERNLDTQADTVGASTLKVKNFKFD